MDVAIIGGGVSGCSLLYALSRYDLDVVLFEKTNDVGVATTKANSAILHAGYDPVPGTLMAKYNVRGNALTKEICKDLHIIMQECGSIVVGFDEQDEKTLAQLYQRGQENGVPGLELLDQQALREKEPNIAPECTCGLYAASAAIVNPWELAFAQAEVAVQNGARVLLDTEITGIEKNDQGFLLKAGAESYQTRFVVNAAGIHAAQVAELAGVRDFEIHTMRGEYFLLDKSQGDLVRHTIFECPTPLGKGVLVSPTVHGNLIVGPNSQAADSTATTRAGLDFVKEKAFKSVPGIQFRESIRNFAGLRAEASTGDFIVGECPALPGFYNLAGIKSPGLTAATAIAEDLVQQMGQKGLPLVLRQNYNNRRDVSYFDHLSQQEKAQMIQKDPRYGRIVCRCATVTEGEIVHALHRPLPPKSLDAVKRRTNAGMGRCQGGFCGPRVQAIIARELGMSQLDVPQDETGTYIVSGRTKEDSASTGGTHHE